MTQTVSKPKPKPIKPIPAKPAPKVLRRYITRRQAVDAFLRMRTMPDGTRLVLRFNLGQRIEHMILLLSFTTLAVTGLSQTYSTSAPGNLLLNLLGGIEQARAIHHLAAFIFGALALYHVGAFIYRLFVFHDISRMLPDWSDVQHFIQMIRLDLGLSHTHPFFDRYNFEEKAEYWALVWGTLVMAATGLMQLFPILVTNLVPGWFIPFARAVHKWEAILAVLAILTWHFYHSVLKKLNVSIFSGWMTWEEMQEEHPLELAYLERMAAAARGSSWPVLIEIPLEAEPEARAAQPAAEPPAALPAAGPAGEEPA